MSHEKAAVGRKSSAQNGGGYWPLAVRPWSLVLGRWLLAGRQFGQVTGILQAADGATDRRPSASGSRKSQEFNSLAQCYLILCSFELGCGPKRARDGLPECSPAASRTLISVLRGWGDGLVRQNASRATLELPDEKLSFKKMNFDFDLAACRCTRVAHESASLKRTNISAFLHRHESTVVCCQGPTTRTVADA